MEKGFGVQMLDYDILLLQETKINPESIFELEGFHSYFHSSERIRGYSGVSIHSKRRPDRVFCKFDPLMDDEGRFIAADFGDLRIINVYTPNAKDDCSRMDHQMEFLYRVYRQFFTDPTKKILFVGDLNFADQPSIDIGSFISSEWWKVPMNGIRPEQVAGTDVLFGEYGFVDLYRLQHPGAIFPQRRPWIRPENYKDVSWFSSQTFAKLRGLGWRVDYVFASWALYQRLKETGYQIRNLQVYPYSDHVPILIDLPSSVINYPTG